MKNIVAAAVAALCLFTISACTSAPAVPYPAAPGVAKAPAMTTVPLTADLDALTKAARTQGYVPRSHNGTIVFCRSEPEIGSRLESTSCISQDDVANVVQRALGNQDSVDSMQRKSLLQSQCHMKNGDSFAGC